MVGSSRSRCSGQAGVPPLLQSSSAVKGRDGWELSGDRKGTSLSYWEGRFRERIYGMFVSLSWSGNRIRGIGTRKGILYGTSDLVGRVHM